LKIFKLAPTVLILLTLPLTVLHLAAQGARSASGSLSEPQHKANIPCLLHTWTRLWDKGYLVSWGSVGSHEASPSEPAVVLYDRDGRVAREGIVWFKDGSSVGINDVAINRAGVLVVAGGTENKAGAIANFIASIGNDGRLGKVIRTTPFLPVYVCVPKTARFGATASTEIGREGQSMGP
jgi:hypothetical protein